MILSSLTKTILENEEQCETDLKRTIQKFDPLENRTHGFESIAKCVVFENVSNLLNEFSKSKIYQKLYIYE
jgi:hypothetical protein